ncbi:tyrosine-protein phosphatase non-receptor type 4-like protein [Dinothrombium tinctorium]|uniref:protein-tyrosine-phosphatase n=1 Tax=Dinothrombium tinctorium TaxID=1965070 RepID=A0A3S3QZM7_9ACAR|nr:tyrosine-protein phosphatase non-receptor type 4-like protein [Dinothrombium tinctorium]
MSKRNFVSGFGGNKGTYNVRESELFEARIRQENNRNHVTFNAKKPVKTIRCQVFFLDSTQHTFEIDKRAKGEMLLESVFQHLELIEKDYFGLQFVDCHNQHAHNQRFSNTLSSLSSANSVNCCLESFRWLDASKSIKKQVKGESPYFFYFGVKFYVSDPSKLQEEYTRYHFFLQLRKDILDGKLIVPSPSAVLLASYIVQSELGDYCTEEHKPGYISNLRLLPNQNEELENSIANLHALHKGQTPADAEFNFLDHIKRLDMYGVDLHRARDSMGSEIQLGVCSAGIVVFQNNVRINTFSWAKIIKISFKRKHFFIQLRREGNESFDNVLGFNLLTYRSCKNLWKNCVEHHTFFRLQIPKPQTRKFFFFFSLGSKFRYSGKTEFQTIEEGRRRARPHKTFVRTPSRRYARQTVPTTSASPRAIQVPCSSSSAPSRSNSSLWQTTKMTNGISNSAASPNGQQQSSNASYSANCTVDEKVTVNIYIFAECAQRHTQRTLPRSVLTMAQETLQSDTSFRPPALSFRNLPYIDSSSTSSKEPSLEKQIPAPPSTSSSTANDENIKNLRLCIFNDESPTQGQPGLITIHMKPDEQGRFGFNVKGGADQNLPVLVSRVAPNTPADTAAPKLNEGDQVVSVNGKDVEGLTHEEVVKLIRSTKERAPGGELVLIIRPNVYTRTMSVGDEDLNDDEPPFQYIPVDASPSSRLRSKCDRLHESIMLMKEALETGSIITQFEQLERKKSGESMNMAKLPDNILKNRYKDISPYDSTRVVLNIEAGDYINASYVNMEIPTSGIVNRYIATQGPLSNTTDDFWEMVWEQKSSLIIMVTPLMERGRVKCHKYWPDVDDYEELDNYLKVSCVKETDTSSMVERELKLTHEKLREERDITHLQYLAWPDHGVPEDAKDFLGLIQKVRNIRCGMVEPIIVHCSAGIGRTGVLILMETAMCLIEANEPIYPIEIVKAMRDQRAMLIQTSSQFRFVVEAIIKVYEEGIVKPLKEYSHR